MQVIQYGNIYYFGFIMIGIVLTIGCVFLLRNKSRKYIHNFIFILLVSAFVLHFLKLLFEPYVSGLPQTIRKSTFENICAVSTLLFPWFYISKKKYLHDYMVVIGILSGLSAYIIPTEALGKDVYTFDVIRFYYAHLIIFLAPFLMVYFKLYRLELKRIFFIPFIFYGILAIILINEIILITIDYVEGDFNSLFDPNYRNSSFIFGPTEYFQNARWILTMFVPKFLIIPFYWPIIWLMIPAYLYICLFGFIIWLIFNGKEIKIRSKRI